jgi:hypothetical protein
MHTMFGDALLASAAMDRLLHYATVIEIEGESGLRRSPESGRLCSRGSGHTPTNTRSSLTAG